MFVYNPLQKNPNVDGNKTKVNVEATGRAHLCALADEDVL